MEAIRKLETTIEGWLKPVPHLPAAWRKWIASNVWWMAIIGIVLSVLGAFALLNMMLLFGAVTSFLTVNSALTHTSLGSMWFIAAALSLAMLVLTIIISAKAVTPLKNLNKKGWDLMFLLFVIGVVVQIVTTVINISEFNFLSGIIGIVIGTAIGAYFLFEIRSYFKA